MDYEKNYKEALERARALRKEAIEKGYAVDYVKDYETIFPELRESEDERVRKVIYKLMLGMRGEIFTAQDEIVTKEKVLAYLEKQKEQKPASISCGHENDTEWNDTDMKEARYNLISVCRAWERGEQTALLPIVAARARYFLEHLTKPKPAKWSEEEKQKEHQNNSDAREKALGRELTFPQDKDKNLDEIAQDYVDGVKEYNPEPTWDLMQTAVCYGYHYCEMKEQRKERSHFVMQVLSDGHMKKAIELYSDECDCKVGDVVKAIIRKKD